MKADAAKKVVKKASKLTNPVEALKCVPQKVTTTDGEPITLEFQWATHLSSEQADWIFQLFCVNMRDMYNQSLWGFDAVSKKQELLATTSRFMLVKNSEQKYVGFLHYRFVTDHDYPVLYCYELQVMPSYQNKGIGSILLGLAESVARNAGMAKLMATVFAFNGMSLAFFHKNGFVNDETCPEPEDGLDYLILSKPTSSA